jgi:nitroimidazol reductase NimA-like FMN-containing flavoprotein (pyridoxamine 5'-phosphate oxidase superfamily)
MLIQEITKQDSLNRLTNMRLGRLACAQGAQPYITPFYFAYDSNYLYSFSTVGQKIDWMRVNPLVCVETDEVQSSEEWVSMIIFGRYEELPNTLEWETERERAHKLLQQKAIWWEPGYVKTIVQGAERPLVPVYFRIYIEQITGHQGSAGRA